MYIIYWLINEDKKSTYLGFTNNIKQRLEYHKKGKVKSTKNFGNFKAYKLEDCESLDQARIKEKYWKSSIGRKKLKILYNKIMARSSNG